MSRPIVAAGALVAMLGPAVAGCGGQGPDGGPAAQVAAHGDLSMTEPLSWAPCKDRSAAQASPSASPASSSSDPGDTKPGRDPKAARYECARLTVPLDYAKPTGDTIEIEVIRARATGPGQRIGSLIFNFGGPGASGVDTLVQAASDFKKLNTRYDLVSFDPRGIGRSSPVLCLDDRQMDAMQQSDSSPDDSREEAIYTAEQRAFVQACESRSGKVLPYVGTSNAAKDMDRLRAALGDTKMHYFGISYGTELGANYAHQFPTNVGRMVLDGAVDTKLGTEALTLQQTAAFQRALGDFARHCVESGPRRCPLSAGGKDADAIVSDVAALIQKLDAHPLDTAQGRKLSQTLGVTGVATGLYSTKLWPALAQGLMMAYEGDGTILLSLADAQNGRDENGRYNNIIAANTAVTCDDTNERFTVEDVKGATQKFRNVSSVFGSSMVWNLLQCTGWPVAGENAGQDVNAQGAPPIVVVGNIGDPATPYAWAPALAKELGVGVLITLEGEGHGAYDTGDPCIRSAVDGYLLDGKVPADGTRCK
ncbi:alpha/beta hydrolase [Microtetraspora sp. NBRC 13810]|uniref:alpha/beta hydrolase n=1 Tax=Microtetraspora sp. NBRC 13810 TaxID=3030990 RepID=UPI00255770D0|nr:alpha/beta hydrolase [Microtetraspora sp. NBRC 13810]